MEFSTARPAVWADEELKRQEVTARHRCCPGIETWESTQRLQAECVPTELTLPPNTLLLLVLHCPPDCVMGEGDS